MSTKRSRSYKELMTYGTFDERLDYLRLGGGVGRPTFGSDRHLNQRFYTSREWRDVRAYVITRDLGCDLGVYGHEIHSGLTVHHINPMSPDDVARKESWILDPEYLITTSHHTHNVIHYDSEVKNEPEVSVQRTPGDTTLW